MEVGAVSEYICTRCDCKGCGAVTPDEPQDIPTYSAVGWSRLWTYGRTYDLCPECTRKAMEAVGLDGDE